MRALLTALALAACATQPAPPPVYPEAELAPGQILAPIRRMMGDDIAFTNATLVHEGEMQVEGYRADGSYTFTLTLVGDRWMLTKMERTGPAP